MVDAGATSAKRYTRAASRVPIPQNVAGTSPAKMAIAMRCIAAGKATFTPQATRNKIS